MGWMIMSLAILLLIAWAVLRSKGWKTLLVGTGDNAEELEAKYAYLKSNNVKCRIRTEASAGMGIAQADPNARVRSTVKLDVHQDDAERAAELLQQFERQSFSL
ncbi:hypothetical protein ACFFNY_22030 [Paenibacillus hodogayensis]|uniref:DUF2007 domain-containing protein n=1 Tax=Paenibacillus hodogayensis TaxID=279208 RepID=A0ABV5W170_9BACL